MEAPTLDAVASDAPTLDDDRINDYQREELRELRRKARVRRGCCLRLARRLAKWCGACATACASGLKGRCHRGLFERDNS